MKLTSPVFNNGKYIPAEYTSEGSGISPSLQWFDIPAETRSFAIVMTDFDIPSPARRWAKFFHWIVYNIPAEISSLPVDFSGQVGESGGPMVAANGGGNRCYYPPCPVFGTHEYVFQIFALDVTRISASGEKPEQIIQEISHHTLETGKLVGLYSCTKLSIWQALRWNFGRGHQIVDVVKGEK
jgi:Raf kinase inhibitor-like YbhB/YbcL family protein